MTVELERANKRDPQTLLAKLSLVNDYTRSVIDHYGSYLSSVGWNNTNIFWLKETQALTSLVIIQ